jgi:acetylglutamate kinase
MNTRKKLNQRRDRNLTNKASSDVEQSLFSSMEPDIVSYEPNNEPSGVTLVKIGGSTLGSHDTTLDDLVDMQKAGEKIVVVHGGGKTISQWMERQGIRPKFVDGLRVTDSDSLEIVVAVLTGLINKSLVAEINIRGGEAIGLSGADGGMVKASITNPDLGYVGSVNSIDTNAINSALNSNYIPIIAPVGFDESKKSGELGALLNINADTVAGYISASLKAERMIFLTDVEGVMDSSKRLLPRITRRQAHSLIRSNIISGGMLPKIEACISALDGGAVSQIIDGRKPGALKEAVSGKKLGTRIG